MNDIHFTWNGKEYLVNGSAYNLNYIVLPDGTVIRPTIWLDSFPPQLGNAQEVSHVFQHMTAGEVVIHMGSAVLAREDV
jgi:hypothetical protein